MDRKDGIPVAGGPEQSFWLGRAREAGQQERERNVAQAEPRHSLRRRSKLDVLVNHGLTYSKPWHVRDLSLEGAFVEMDTSQLPEGSRVEIVLRYRYKHRRVELRLPAAVTRVDGQGLALTFGYYDDQTYTDLANLLYAS